ncbi:serine/threonine-protein kinase [Streptomyces sp. V4I2]|uniref:serine/threonine-protein kinase n=1 Tax=Streptomyces sp. V4I2 TaxID=3042280 RepID=UPI00278ABD35|nr:serine/threonine-protein kinase [Streptomyces sp. V4I2]MDQ1047339.1 serine/threonine protein kinase [Streptomyces sp. V4I2]
MLIAGRYRLHDPIGRGAMGEVWRAFDETLGRTVAVKLLLPHDSDPTATSRFRLEAQTAGRLNHPHVVGVYDFGEYDGRLFLVMELVEGDSLARRLSTAGPLPVEQVARIAAQAAAGLAAAHQQGIVHRDIKPANLLLDPDGTLKIGDFGIARFVDDPSGALTTTGQIVGTSLYLAPERALGQAAGPASDVYALGCLLYQLLTGRPPFQADTAVAILHQHLDATPVPPRQTRPELPPAFENFLLGLLAKRPEDRPATQQIAEWFGGGAWQGRSEPLPEPAPARQAATSLVPPPTGPGVPGGSEAGPATTYALPSATVRPSRSRTTGSPGARGLVAHRPRVMATAAAVLVFLAAMLAGMLWFSPGNSSAESPGNGTPGATTPGASGGSGWSEGSDGSDGSAGSEAHEGSGESGGSATNLSDTPEASPTSSSPTPTPTPTATPSRTDDGQKGKDGQDGQDKGKDEEDEPDEEG